jgi:hypothetical protein
MAGYFMRFDSQYLMSPSTDVLDYFLDYLNTSTAVPAPTNETVHFQRADAYNQTIFFGLMVTLSTLVSLVGASWMLFSAFQGAKVYTIKAASRLESIEGDSAIALGQDAVSTISEINFFSSAAPDWAAMLALVSGIVVASIATHSSIVSLTVGLGLSVVALIARHAFVAFGGHYDQIGGSQEIGRSIATQSELEKIVRDSSIFTGMGDFRNKFGVLEAAVCAIESPQAGGTGFLVGCDLVLTNYHVIKRIHEKLVSPKDMQCRFDYLGSADNSGVKPGRVVKLADENWLVHYRPYSLADITGQGKWKPKELDYALLRLKEPVGNQPRTTQNTVPRGWISLDHTTPQIEAKATLLLVQHPRDIDVKTEIRVLPMQLAIGSVLGFEGDGLRIRHDTRTLPGSSGAPCCNANLQLVALHHAGDPKDLPGFRGQYNQAIPIGLIIDDLREHPIASELFA